MNVGESMNMIKIGDIELLLDRYYFTQERSHIWLMKGENQDGLFKMGFSPFLTRIAGFLSYITIDAGTLTQGAGMGQYESAKFVNRFFAPISGRVIQTNNVVLEDPRLVNTDPYGAWLVAIEPSNLQQEIESEFILTDAADIEAWAQGEMKLLEEQD